MPTTILVTSSSPSSPSSAAPRGAGWARSRGLVWPAPRTARSDAWLASLALDAADERSPVMGPAAPNAAELWDARLPGATELAIHAERVRRDLRTYDVQPGVYAEPMVEELEVDHHALARAATLRWALASLAMVVGIVGLLVLAAGVRL